MRLGGSTKSHAVILFTVLLFITICGLLIVGKAKLLNNSNPQKSSEVVSEYKKLKITDTTDLVEVFIELSKTELKECRYFDNCFDEVFSQNTKIELARMYGIAENISEPDDIRIGLLQGKTIEVTGIGKSYLENKKYLDIKDDSWYWEIGACSTNNRAFVDAVTGKSGPVHAYVYCGGIP